VLIITSFSKLAPLTTNAPRPDWVFAANWAISAPALTVALSRTQVMVRTDWSGAIQLYRVALFSSCISSRLGVKVGAAGASGAAGVGFGAAGGVQARANAESATLAMDERIKVVSIVYTKRQNAAA
jgi:hypothetical protein